MSRRPQTKRSNASDEEMPSVDSDHASESSGSEYDEDDEGGSDSDEEEQSPAETTAAAAPTLGLDLAKRHPSIVESWGQAYAPYLKDSRRAKNATNKQMTDRLWRGPFVAYSLLTADYTEPPFWKWLHTHPVSESEIKANKQNKQYLRDYEHRLRTKSAEDKHFALREWNVLIRAGAAAEPPSSNAAAAAASTPQRSISAATSRGAAAATPSGRAKQVKNKKRAASPWSDQDDTEEPEEIAAPTKSKASAARSTKAKAATAAASSSSSAAAAAAAARAPAPLPAAVPAKSTAAAASSKAASASSPKLSAAAAAAILAASGRRHESNKPLASKAQPALKKQNVSEDPVKPSPAAAAKRKQSKPSPADDLVEIDGAVTSEAQEQQMRAKNQPKQGKKHARSLQSDDGAAAAAAPNPAPVASGRRRQSDKPKETEAPAAQPTQKKQKLPQKPVAATEEMDGDVADATSDERHAKRPRTVGAKTEKESTPVSQTKQAKKQARSPQSGDDVSAAQDSAQPASRRGRRSDAPTTAQVSEEASSLAPAAAKRQSSKPTSAAVATETARDESAAVSSEPPAKQTRASLVKAQSDERPGLDLTAAAAARRPTHASASAEAGSSASAEQEPKTSKQVTLDKEAADQGDSTTATVPQEEGRELTMGKQTCAGAGSPARLDETKVDPVSSSPQPEHKARGVEAKSSQQLRAAASISCPCAGAAACTTCNLVLSNTVNSTAPTHARSTIGTATATHLQILATAAAPLTSVSAAQLSTSFQSSSREVEQATVARCASQAVTTQDIQWSELFTLLASATERIRSLEEGELKTNALASARWKLALELGPGLVRLPAAWTRGDSADLEAQKLVVFKWLGLVFSKRIDQIDAREWRPRPLVTDRDAEEYPAFFWQLALHTDLEVRCEIGLTDFDVIGFGLGGLAIYRAALAGHRRAMLLIHNAELQFAAHWQRHHPGDAVLWSFFPAAHCGNFGAYARNADYERYHFNDKYLLQEKYNLQSIDAYSMSDKLAYPLSYTPILRRIELSKA